MNRVRVNIRNHDHYTKTSVENMNGKSGVIIDRRKGDNWDKERALVRFDTPAARLYDNGREIKEFWFQVEDLMAWPWKNNYKEVTSG